MNGIDKILALVFLSCFIAVWGLVINSSSWVPSFYVNDASDRQDAERIEVHLEGCIKNPGVYEVEKNLRLYDVISQGGGVGKNADMKSLDMDRIITSSQRVHVSALPDAMVSATPDFGGKININTANEKVLTNLKGIGNTVAGRIIQYRNTNGSFKTTEEIKNVKGIGEAVYAEIKDYITVEGE